MREQFLLGANNDNELVFGDFEITTRNGHKEFSACFDIVRPFNEDEIDEEYVEGYLGDFDKETLYDLCEQYECSPQDLPSFYFENNDTMEIVDCSLYQFEYEVNGDSWLFESSSCGQCDTKDTMVEYTNKKAYLKLIDIWEKYHLKQVDEDVENEVEQIINELCDINEEDWICDFIKRTFY